MSLFPDVGNVEHLSSLGYKFKLIAGYERINQLKVTRKEEYYKVTLLREKVSHGIWYSDTPS